MMPLPQHEHRSAALQYRWFSTGRGTVRLEVPEHTSEHLTNSSLAAYCNHSTSSDTMLHGVERGVATQVTQVTACKTTTARFKSP